MIKIYSIAAALEYMHGQDVPITHGNVKAVSQTSVIKFTVLVCSKSLHSRKMC